VTIPERYRNPQSQTGFQRLVDAVLYRGPEILAGLLLILIGWLLPFPPAIWLGLAFVLGAHLAAVARFRRDAQNTANATEQATRPPAPRGQTDAPAAGPPDRTADHAMSHSTTVDQPESGRQA
jgi:hypothetical protein